MIPIAVVKMFNVLISYILFFGRIVNVYHQEESVKIIIVFNDADTEDRIEVTHVSYLPKKLICP